MVENEGEETQETVHQDQRLDALQVQGTEGLDEPLEDPVQLGRHRLPRKEVKVIQVSRLPNFEENGLPNGGAEENLLFEGQEARRSLDVFCEISWFGGFLF